MRRRPHLIFALSLFVAFCAAAFGRAPATSPAAPATPAGGDWTQFRGDSALTGRAAAPLPRDLRPVWKFKAQAGIAGTAAIAGGTVYVGSLDGNLYALRLADGGLLFKVRAEGPIKAAPAVRDGVVYFGSTDGNLYAVK